MKERHKWLNKRNQLTLVNIKFGFMRWVFVLMTEGLNEGVILVNYAKGELKDVNFSGLMKPLRKKCLCKLGE